MADDVSDEFMCYVCHRTSSVAQDILEHTIRNHAGPSNFSVRLKVLDESTGRQAYRSLHYGIKISEIKRKIDDGCKPYIDIHQKKISYKRPSKQKESISEQREEVTNETESQTTNSDFFQLLPEVLENLSKIGRLEDFYSVLSAISNGTLLENIAFHLLLDIGKFYSNSTVFGVRYSKETLDFWLTIKKLFKGKGIIFFRGYKSQGTDGELIRRPIDCKINFAVPSDTILARESAKYIAGTETPGIMELPLDAYANTHKGQDVKLSIDGKKLAVGLGKLGDEDMCGFESPPALQERKARIAAEIRNIEEIKEATDKMSLDGLEELDSIQQVDQDIIKTAILISITDMSNRIKELRELVVKKKIALGNLLKQVEGDWKTSKVAPAISFYKTKIVHSQATIKELLGSVDKLGYIVACINGTGHQYIIGSQSVVNLNHQTNYICLKSLSEDIIVSPQTANMIKQRSDEWFELRKGSRITGSTIFRGIGLGTLKEQQQHYDKAFHEKETPVSAELQELFDYGTSQEINALGTLVSKILPVYFPDLVYREDGCEVISIGDSYAVISGDGSGVDNNDKVQMAFEFKCPKPGKERTTDVHYQIPKYYSTQLLSQMAAKKCGKFCYISYTPESATVIEGVYDDEIWREIWDSINELYKNDDTRRPSRNKPEQKILLQRLIEYSKFCPFVAEFPSVKSIPCSCTSTNDKDHVFGSHNSEPAINLNPRMTLEDISSTLDAATSQLKDAYEILRRPSKEILLTVMSDIDRMSTRNETAHYAVPIQYALPGYSLTMDIVRKLLIKAVGECKSRDLRVKAVAFDGQFLELAVEDDKGRPLTVLRFMKFFWEKVQKIDRATKISTLLNLNKFPEITDDDSLKANFEVQKDIVVNGKIIITSKTDLKVLPSAINITEAIKKVHSKRNQDMSQNPLPNDVNQIDEQEDLDVLRYIPEDVLSEMNEEAIDSVRHAQKGRNQTREVVTENDTPPEQESMFPIETDFEMALVVLIASSTIANSKWNEVSLDEFKTCFSNAEAIRKSFTVNEMRTILSLTQNKNEYTKMLKPNLVNSICCIYGDGSKLPQPTSSPKCLKALVTNHILKWPILAVNVAYAQLTFPDEFMEWEASNCFNGKGTMRTDTGKTFCISKWYAQPTEINGQLLQPIIDPHHIFVNNRSRCCSKGLHDMGVYSEAWWKVAENYKTNGTGLSLEIAKELRDRQKNAFAHTTFSNKVQAEMEILGFDHEAEWCQLIRNWYSAIDEAGVPIDLRIDWLLAMRNKLLPFLKVGHFPPPGAYVASLPLAQFEGLMSNVDRRLQLYDMVQTGTYNQRAITSLDSETFFSGFQDYDPKGTGVLRPDDIPIALGSAVYLFSQRLNSDRKFYMKTSKKLRVYPEHKLDDPESICDKGNETNDTNTDTHDIQVGSHFFDKMERKSSCLNRKKGIISEFGAPGRGAEGARLYHRTNEERILAHKRFNLKDDDLTDI